MSEKVSELLGLISEHTCRPKFYPYHQSVSSESKERLIEPSVYHALDLVEKMIRNDLEPIAVLKIFKLVLCTHEDDDLRRYLCNAIREAIIFKYIA